MVKISIRFSMKLGARTVRIFIRSREFPLANPGLNFGSLKTRDRSLLAIDMFLSIGALVPARLLLSCLIAINRSDAVFQGSV